MDKIEKKEANNSVEAVNNTIKMLEYVRISLNDRKVFYQNRLKGIKMSIDNAIYKYSVRINQLKNSIIYVEVEDEYGNKHIESPNENEVYSKISYYNQKINKCNQMLNEYNKLYKEYYNGIERNIGITENKIKSANGYLGKLTSSQKKYGNVEMKKDLSDIDFFGIKNDMDIGYLESGQLSNEDLIEMAMSECCDESFNNNYEYAMEQLARFEKVGGSYSELKSMVQEKGLGYLLEVHHVPPRSSAQIIYKRIGKGGKVVEEDISPAIIVLKVDHIKTASFGNSKESIKFQKMQRELVKSGKYLEAFANEKNDIKSNFGNKYDRQLKDVEDYITTLYLYDNINMGE